MRFPIAVSLTLATLAPPVLAAPAPSGVTVFHWWTSPSELEAVEALTTLFQKKYPGVPTYTSTADAHGGGARMFFAIRAATAKGNPPAAFQVHAGAPLRPYLDARLLSPIDAVWADEGLDKVVPPIVQSMSRIDGRYYSVPMNVHRNNLIWYNRALLDKHKIDPAALVTWDAFFEAAEKLKSAGVRSPCQLGVAWTASVAFESILASLGIEGYEDWINGKITAGDDPRLLKAFGLLKTYLLLANPDYATTDWPIAIQRVIRGEAAFCMMGDWANGEFRLAKQTYGKDYGAIPVPGAKGLYAATIDGFARPPGATVSANADRWMRLAASREGQDAFNAAKGSISARTDADPSGYDLYQRAAMADFKAARVIYPNLQGSTHDAFKVGLDKVMAAFATDLDVKKAAAAVAAAAARSQGKFTRVWSLTEASPAR
jgi:glucose/mannose transport system substrate-binding protein